MPAIEEFEIVTRELKLNAGAPRPIKGCTPRALIKALQECEPDAAVIFSVVLPDGKCMYIGVQGVITDYDGSGNGVLLCDNNSIRRFHNAAGTPW